ncbi:hypothetical protein A6E03_18985 [Aliivibrio sp. 1S128]|nr:hypothetical protein A6E03_18985 [Aliivibrio sp. 1S128]
MKNKHKLRYGSSVFGILLIFIALIDGYCDFLPYLDSAWLLASGVLLVGLSARKPVGNFN